MSHFHAQSLSNLSLSLMNSRFPVGVQVVQFLLRYPVAISPLIMSVHFCLAFLALFSLTTAADHDCEELVQPLEDQSLPVGKWMMYAATSDDEETLKGIKGISSSWIKLQPISGGKNMTIRWAYKMDGKCHDVNVNVSSSGNNTIINNFNGTQHAHEGKHLKTCPNCVLWSVTAESLSEGVKKTSRKFYLYTKSGKLDDEHLEVFKKQAACLNFTPDFHFLNTDLCPEEEASTDAPVKEE